MTKGIEVISRVHANEAQSVGFPCRREHLLPAQAAFNMAALASGDQNLLASSLVISFMELAPLPGHHQMQGCNLPF
jgi:hypothetical protein